MPVITPKKVTEISALSAHRRAVALVRWSPVAVRSQRAEATSGENPVLSPGPAVVSLDASRSE